MGYYSMTPLNTRQRVCRPRRRFIPKWMLRVLRNRLMLRVVLWTAKVLWQVVRFVSDHS